MFESIVYVCVLVSLLIMSLIEDKRSNDFRASVISLLTEISNKVGE